MSQLSQQFGVPQSKVRQILLSLASHGLDNSGFEAIVQIDVRQALSLADRTVTNQYF